jgi:hypothetical protein
MNQVPDRWFHITPIGHVRRPMAAPFDLETYYDPFAETMLETLPR